MEVEWTIGRGSVPYILASSLADFIATRKSLPTSKVAWGIPTENGVVKKAKEGDEGSLQFVAKQWYLDAIKPHTRGDKAASRQNKKFEVERVIKGCLEKRLVDKGLRDAIYKRVHDLSKATHRAGLLLSLIVTRAMEEGLQIPLLDTTFFYNLLNASSSCKDDACKDDACECDSDAESDADSNDDFDSDEDDESEATMIPENLKKQRGGICTVGTEALAKALPLANDIPESTRNFGDANCLVMAASSMKTCVFNSIIHAFAPRLKRYVKTWCRQDPEARGDWLPIVSQITGWREEGGGDATLSREAQEFVIEEMRQFGNPKRMSEAWLKSHPRTVFSAYHRWLRFFETHDFKVFPLTPIYNIRAHFMKIDSVTLYGIMKEGNIYGGNLAQFKEDAEVQWGTVFNTSGLASKKWSPTLLVETDGVSLCTHFRRQKNPKELKIMQDEKAAKASRLERWLHDKESRLAKRDAAESRREVARMAKEEKRTLKNDMDALKISNPVEYKRLMSVRRADNKLAREKAGPKVKKVREPTEDVLDYSPPPLVDGCAAVDPGVSNISFVGQVVNGKIVTSRFTKGRYYTEGGVRQLAKLTLRWQESLDTSELDKVSAKTASLERLTLHLFLLGQVYDCLWIEKTKRRWARGRFNTYVMKPKAVDKFIGEIMKKGPIDRLYYGAGKWSPSQKGRETAPVDAVAKRWKIRFQERMFMTDEHLTSQCCWKCGARSQPVGCKGCRTKAVRGLLCCDSSKCGVQTSKGLRGYLVNRDFQGVMNILACGMATVRPIHLTRQWKRESKRTDKVYICSRLCSNTCLGGKNTPCRFKGQVVSRPEIS